MNKIVSLRPHHLERFARYLRGEQVLQDHYSPEFSKRVTALYQTIAEGQVEEVKIVDGLDDVCKICREITDREKPSCSEGGETFGDPSALQAMASSRLRLNRTYPIIAFLRSAKKIHVEYSSKHFNYLLNLALKRARDDQHDRN